MPMMDPRLGAYLAQQQGLLRGGPAQPPQSGAQQNAQLTGYARPGLLNAPQTQTLPPPSTGAVGGPLNQQAMGMAGNQGAQPAQYQPFTPDQINPTYVLPNGQVPQYGRNDNGRMPPLHVVGGLNPYTGQLANVPQQQQPSGGAFNQLAMLLAARGR